MTNEQIDIRRAAERFHTDIGWLDSWHSFSFGEHQDRKNVGHGLLIVSNDDRVAPGGGFGTHGHRDMEIVTWVLEGELEHRDSIGTDGVIYPGLAQRMSAGSGIRHSEMNHSAVEPVHFVQMWVVPDRVGIKPGYQQLDVSDLIAGGGLVPVASGRGDDGAIEIHQSGAVMSVARMAANDQVELPSDRYVHLFVAKGAVVLAGAEFDGTTLIVGDAVRLTDAGPLAVTADQASEIIVWQSNASVLG